MTYAIIKQRIFRGIKYYYDDTGDNRGYVKFAFDVRFTPEGSCVPYKNYILTNKDLFVNQKVYKVIRYKTNTATTYGTKFYIILLFDNTDGLYYIKIYDNLWNDITSSVLTIASGQSSTTRIDAVEWKGRVYYITSNGLFYTNITNHIQVTQAADYGDYVFSTVNVKGYKYMAVYKDRLFLANDELTGQNDKVIWCFPFEEDKFEVNNFKYFTDNFNDEITGMASTENMLVFFKNNSTYYMLGDNEYNFTFEKLANIGCIAENTIDVYDRYVFFLGLNGAYVISYNSSELFTKSIFESINDNLMRANGTPIDILDKRDIFGRFVPFLNEYWLYLFSENDLRYVLTYNIITQSISLYTIGLTMTIRKNAYTDTTIMVDNIHLVEVGNIVKNLRTGERMEITDVDNTNSTITVNRGYGGTSVVNANLFDELLIEGSNFLSCFIPLSSSWDNDRLLLIGDNVYEYGVNNKVIKIETYNYGWDTDEYVKFFRRLFLATKELEYGSIDVYVDDSYKDSFSIHTMGAKYDESSYDSYKSCYVGQNIKDNILSLSAGVIGKTIKFIIKLKATKLENLKVQLKGKRRLW